MLSVRARPGIGSTRTQDSKACSELVAVGDERETTGTEAQDSPPPSGEESDLPLDEAAESLPDGYLTIGSPLERLEGAEAAYRRGDERGDGRAASGYLTGSAVWTATGLARPRADTSSRAVLR